MQELYRSTTWRGRCTIEYRGLAPNQLEWSCVRISLASTRSFRIYSPPLTDSFQRTSALESPMGTVGGLDVRDAHSPNSTRTIIKMVSTTTIYPISMSDPASSCSPTLTYLDYSPSRNLSASMPPAAKRSHARSQTAA
jgi:hypothetical protein